MTEEHKQPDEQSDNENEVFPLEPSYHPLHRVTRLVYDFLASAKLAMALLVFILGCCVTGVTVWRGVEAGRMIFGTVWFNGVLVLLVVNVACCFFGRIWGRRITVVSFGMILFHLSFVVMLLAIVYNSLFYFRGNIRVTEGESIPSGDRFSYDLLSNGSFFNMSQIKGETSLIRLHTGYKVDGKDKRVAYEVEIGEPAKRTKGIIYATHKVSHQGFDYFSDKEGYSLLIMLADRSGKAQYGAHVPMQSIPFSKSEYQYSTGYRDYEKQRVEKDFIPYPAPPEKPLFALKVEYMPEKDRERRGNVRIEVLPLDAKGMPDHSRKLADSAVAIGTPVVAGEYQVKVEEVRYWVGMLVRYEPGKPFLLGSLWVGLAGMIITTIGRMLRSGKKS